MTAIILAAGLSTRFGGKKLLAIIDNTPMIQHVLRLVSFTEFTQVILVYSDCEVEAAALELADAIPNFTTVHNPTPELGLSSSIKVALTKGKIDDCYLFLLGDQPFLDPATVEKLITAYRQNKGSVIVPLYNGKRGNPVLFAGKWRDGLLSLTGDTGGREIIKANPNEVYQIEIGNERIGRDIDTPEDYTSI